jgi:hypothetical protein
LDKINPSKSVNVTWTMNRTQYQYWRAFYATVGSRTFLCDLVGEDGMGPAEHTCNIVPGSVTLPRQQGLTYVQQCQLDVRPLHDKAADLAIMSAFEQSDGQPEMWYAALERLTNVTIPALDIFDA